MPKIVPSQIWDDSMEVHCPMCGFENCHMEEKATYVEGYDDYKAHEQVRGDALKIPMFCEQSHRFLLIIGFHKGTLRVWCESLGSVR